MGLSARHQREIAAWEKDKAKFQSGEWTKATLMAVSYWRCWNNIDIARRVRAGNQDRANRTIVAEYASGLGGLSDIGLEIGKSVLQRLMDNGYTIRPDCDHTGGENGVAWIAVTIKPLLPNKPEVKPPMPNVLKKQTSSSP